MPTSPDVISLSGWKKLSKVSSRRSCRQREERHKII